MTAPVQELLTPAEVAELFRVDPKTVTRWAKAGRLDSVRTPGGHRRYSRVQVLAMRGEHAMDEARLRSQDITTICDALSRGPDEAGAKERIGKALACLGPGAVIRVTG